MQKNVGGIDKGIRVVVGIAVIAAGVIYQTWWGAIGIIPLVTALTGWCPPYAILGINTCKTKQAGS